MRPYETYSPYVSSFDGLPGRHYVLVFFTRRYLIVKDLFAKSQCLVTLHPAIYQKLKAHPYSINP